MSDVVTKNVIIDDEYVEIDDQFEQIRNSLGMYISKRGTEGAYHLLKEIFNNALDEVNNPLALAKNITLCFDERLQQFTIADHSRGIPFEKMVNVCMKKHSSTKFTRTESKMKQQCGRNGVGLVVTAALSRYFAMTSYRGDKGNKLIEFKDGELVDHEPVASNKKQTGLSVTFVPEAKYLEGPVDIRMELIEDYMRLMSYIIPEDVKIDFTGICDTKEEQIIHTKYKRTGLTAAVQHMSSTLEFTPVEVAVTTEDFDIELAFSYDKTTDETAVTSFCNYVFTTEGGHHETASQRAICEYFVKEAKKLDNSSKYEVIYEDCKKGLIFAVNCLHINPAYEGQHKSKVSNDDILTNGKKELIHALIKHFNNNNALLRKVVTYLRQIAKIRLEAHKIKGTTPKKQTTFMDDAGIRGFYPLADRNHKGYAEFIIAEGDSAGDAIDNCRNPLFQAIYAVMGVVDNVYGITIQQLRTKPVFWNLVQLLGCGIGPDFDITKLRYNKIILEVDADSDGNNIASLVLAFFIWFLPELIIQGKVYKALPPLFLLNEKSVRRWYKDSCWLFDKNEYYDIINRIISENTSIALANEDKEVVVLKKKDAKMWLGMNAEYFTEIDRLVRKTRCHIAVLEWVCWFKLKCINDKTEDRFKHLIETKFTELEYDLVDNCLSGSYNGISITLFIDKLFMKSTKRFMKILELNDSPIVFTKNKNNDDKFDEMTIGQFNMMMNSIYTVKIEQRYKGLGEAEAEILFITTLNPKVRKLIQFDVSNVEEALETFEVLHGKSPKMREKRRELLDEAEISFMDIDN